MPQRLRNRGAAYAAYEPAYRYGYELGTQRALPGARLGRPGSGRPPRLGSAASQHLGALQRRHPLWLGQSPRADLGQRTTAPGTASAVPGVAPTVRRNFHIPTDLVVAKRPWLSRPTRALISVAIQLGTRFGAP